jgi:hypothetical protein
MGEYLVYMALSAVSLLSFAFGGIAYLSGLVQQAEAEKAQRQREQGLSPVNETHPVDLRRQALGHIRRRWFQIHLPGFEKWLYK